MDYFMTSTWTWRCATHVHFFKHPENLSAQAYLGQNIQEVKCPSLGIDIAFEIHEFASTKCAEPVYRFVDRFLTLGLVAGNRIIPPRLTTQSGILQDSKAIVIDEGPYGGVRSVGQ